MLGGAGRRPGLSSRLGRLSQPGDGDPRARDAPKGRRNSNSIIYRRPGPYPELADGHAASSSRSASASRRSSARSTACAFAPACHFTPRRPTLAVRSRPAARRSSLSACHSSSTRTTSRMRSTASPMSCRRGRRRRRHTRRDRRASPRPPAGSLSQKINKDDGADPSCGAHAALTGATD